MKKLIIGALAFALAALPASAQVPYPTPTGAVVSAVATASGADTSSLSATIGAQAGKLTYGCGLFVGGLGATAATTVTVALTPVIGGSNVNFAYTFPAGATVASTPLFVPFSPCIPATPGQALSVTVPGAAGNTSTVISLWGFYQ